MGLIGLFPLGVSLGAGADAASAQSPLAVVWPPGWSRAQQMTALAEADARLVRFGGAPGVMIVEPSKAQALRQAGALLFLDPEAVGACALSAPSYGADA